MPFPTDWCILVLKFKTVAEKSRCKHFCHERVPPSWANTNGHNSNGLRTVIKINWRSWRAVVFRGRPGDFPGVTSLVFRYKDSTAHTAFRLTRTFRAMSQTLIPPIFIPTIFHRFFILSGAGMIGLLSSLFKARIQQGSEKTQLLHYNNPITVWPFLPISTKKNHNE